jgi:hypothetical protein
MTRRLLIATLIVAAVAAWGAAAAWASHAIAVRSTGSSTPLRLGAVTGTDTSFTVIPVRLRGTLAVQFHGDQATGCAARGLCGYSGTVIWQPPSTGTIDVDSFRDHGRTEYNVSLDLSGNGFTVGPPIDGGTTTADVRFTPNGSAGSSSICTDAAATGADIEMPVNFRAASLTLAAASPSLLGTRCAGPLQSDIASVMARRVVDVATLFHGRAAVDLASSADFAVHGLAGTVTSTVQLSLGRPRTQRISGSGSSSKASKFRTVVLTYRAHLDGSISTHFRGDSSSCAALGACGANGTFALRVHGTPGTLALGTSTSARRPLRDVLTALGLRKDGNPRGILVLGFFVVHGQLTYSVNVAQGQNTCKDTGPAGPDSITLAPTRTRLRTEFDGSLPAPHLRCPGPNVSQVAVGAPPIDHLTRRGGTIHLTGGSEVNDDGYTGRTAANLTLTIGRPKLTVSTDALRAPNPG